MVSTHPIYLVLRSGILKYFLTLLYFINMIQKLAFVTELGE